MPFNLRTDDIAGSQAGTKNRINKFTSPYDLNLNLRDIKGADASSLKKGIVTSRSTNPLNPRYNYIGAKELVGKDFNPYGKSLYQEPEISSGKKIADIDVNSITSANLRHKNDLYPVVLGSDQRDNSRGLDKSDDQKPKQFANTQNSLNRTEAATHFQQMEERR